MKRLLLAALAAGAILIPAGAFANHPNNSCGYAANQEHKQDLGGAAIVYADTNGGGGTSGTADQAVGACTYQAGQPGGAFEAGHSATKGSNDSAWYSLAKDGVYVVADGNRNNPDPADGYAGISNYETGKQGTCDNNGDDNQGTTNDCSGTNGGGHVGAPGGPYASDYGVYLPIVCGNTTGDQWDNSKRDGCEAA
jgi:hypothetical protein